jgi:hypothetical protein
MNNPKIQYLAQDASTIQKVAMAYGGQVMPIKKQQNMYAPTPMVPGQKQAIIMQEMRSTQGGLGPLRQVS